MVLQSERQGKILKHTIEHGFLGLNEAIDLFGASQATISRDFNELAENQQVKRVRGGIQAIKSLVNDMIPFALRETSFSEEKAALAYRAAQLLCPDDVVIIDGGTTTFHLVEYLPNIKLRLITNSVRLAAGLEEKQVDRSLLEIFLTGGFLYPDSGLLLGPGAKSSLAQYHARWAFLSVGGITEEGIFNTNELVVETEQVMIEQADKIVILADHSKIGNRAMCQVCNLDKIDYLITDKWPNNTPLLDKFKKAGVEILQVP